MASQVIQAQFSMAKRLRPYSTFTTDYQGQAGTVPVLFPGGRSSVAGQGTNGIDQDLAASLRVPFGSRAMVYIPVVLDLETNAPILYSWTFVWQVFSAEPALQMEGAHHIGGSGFGSPDFNQLPGQRERYPILAATSGIGYEQAEPSTAALNAAALRMFREEVVAASSGPQQRGLLPGGVQATYEQGILPSNLGPATYKRAAYISHALDCLGDSLIIEARKYTTDGSPPNPWNFLIGQEDWEFGQMFGLAGDVVGQQNVRPYSAVYVATGSNP